MCQQCTTNALYFGTPIPGYHLMRARRSDSEIQVGQWGLIECNDPTFVFTFDFHIKPGTKDWDEQVYKLHEEFGASPVQGYNLVKACIELGYDPAKNFCAWIAQHLLAHLKVTEPEDSDDPFPYLNEHFPHDLSPWVKPE